jgi:hypothetical protein
VGHTEGTKENGLPSRANAAEGLDTQAALTAGESAAQCSSVQPASIGGQNMSALTNREQEQVEQLEAIQKAAYDMACRSEVLRRHCELTSACVDRVDFGGEREEEYWLGLMQLNEENAIAAASIDRQASVLIKATMGAV